MTKTTENSEILRRIFKEENGYSYEYRLLCRTDGAPRFGIEIFCRDGRCETHGALHDVFGNLTAAVRFFDILVKNTVSPVHLPDIYDDR